VAVLKASLRPTTVSACSSPQYKCQNFLNLVASMLALQRPREMGSTQRPDVDSFLDRTRALLRLSLFSTDSCGTVRV
jgi:hypothetical protein